jgi:prolipoprotein diacylglyceryltransferase
MLHNLIPSFKGYSETRDNFIFPENPKPILFNKDSKGLLHATLWAYGIPRHPAQLYEAFTCILLFGLLFALWNTWREKTPRGLLLGIFIVYTFGLRFFYEYLKENQVDFENGMALNMGQWLSLPVLVLGAYLIWQAVYKPLPISIQPKQ